jgi:two-component system cell cycle response regulator DivK
MTDSQIRAEILVSLAELYEDPVTRRQYKRFDFKGRDEQSAKKILEKLARHLIVEASEAYVVRLTDFGYEFIREELEQLRSEPLKNGSPGLDGVRAHVTGSEKPRSKQSSRDTLILIVDDFRDDREMYSYFLTLKGFQVASAGDGTEALKKAFELQPDLIIMDLGLPGMGGWEAIRRLKADEKTKHIPIVVLTARAFISAKAVGSEGCLIKPCQPDKMLAEISHVLSRQTNSSHPRTRSLSNQKNATHSAKRPSSK